MNLSPSHSGKTYPLRFRAIFDVKRTEMTCDVWYFICDGHVFHVSKLIAMPTGYTYFFTDFDDFSTFYLFF